MPESLKVAVIGAGVAGLVAARELRREDHQVTVIEKSDRIGGVWAYDPRVESDLMSQDPTREIVHSSLYHSLRTNLPRVLMGFSDFDFEQRKYGDPRNFPGHEEVLAFLKDFANQFGISELIQLNSEVVRVEQVDGRVDKWVVEWKKQGEKGLVKMEEHVFDAVVICNGHFTQPYIAQIPGIEKWPGKQLHSHNYRAVEPFKDQVVVVFGAGPSGNDISVDISKAAKEVHLSSRYPKVEFQKLDGYHNIWRHPKIIMAKEDGAVYFEDGSSVQPNVILHCTGYMYEFPFLNTNGSVTVDDNRVGPLYKNVYPPTLAPWLSFVGLENKVIRFRSMELQSKWIARVLSGKLCLPSEEEMIADVEHYYLQMTMLNRPKHKTHTVENFDEHLNWVAEQAQTSPVEGWRFNLFREALSKIHNCEKFRDDADGED